MPTGSLKILTAGVEGGALLVHAVGGVPEKY